MNGEADKQQCTIILLSNNVKKNQLGASSYIQQIVESDNPFELGEVTSKDVMIGFPVHTKLINGFFDMEHSFSGVRDTASIFAEVNAFILVIDMNQEPQKTDYYLRNWIPEIQENYPNAQLAFMLTNNHQKNYDNRITEEAVLIMVNRLTHKKNNKFFNEDDVSVEVREIVRNKIEADKINDNKLLETIKSCLSYFKPSYTINRMKRICSHAKWSVEEKLKKICDLARKPHKPMLGQIDLEKAKFYSILKSDESSEETNEDLQKMLQAKISHAKIVSPPKSNR